MAKVVERATSRAVCYAFAQALVGFGAPEEVLSDNGKQFTDRFGKGGEVMFDRICRKNGIKHRLTDPASPNQNGKVESFHGTLRPDFFDVTGPFVTSPRPRTRSMPGWPTTTRSGRTRGWTRTGRSPRPNGSPRSRPSSGELLPLWLPPTLAAVADPSPAGDRGQVSEQDQTGTDILVMARRRDRGAVIGAPGRMAAGPVELDQVVPPSGNMWVAGRQFWLGPARAGLTVRFWADRGDPPLHRR